MVWKSGKPEFSAKLCVLYLFCFCLTDLTYLTYHSMYLSICPFVSLSVCLFVCLSIYLSNISSLSICLSVYLSSNQSNISNLSIYLFVYLSVYQNSLIFSDLI